MRRAIFIASLVAVLLGAVTALAAVLPQQHGRVDLLTQADGQWEGPGEAQGGSATGESVAGLGDIFHDGLSAMAIGAPEADPGNRQSAGSVYIVVGQTGRSRVDLTALIGRGYRIDGANAGDELGFSLAPLTLPNRDPGLAVGAPYANPDGRSSAGAVYIVDLRKLRSNIDLSITPLSHAIVGVITGPEACAQSGYALAAVPQAGGKGDNLLIGSPGADPHGCPADTAAGPVDGNTGAAYLVPGGDLEKRIDLAAPPAGVVGFEGSAPGDRAGTAVAGVGPRTYAIGAPGASPDGRDAAGEVYLAGEVTATIDGSDPGDAFGSALATINGFQAGAGEQLVVGAPGVLNASGAVYLLAVHGAPRTEVLAGAAPGDEAGYSLAAAGDVNGEGRPALIVGAPFTNALGRLDNGAAYVIYGGSGSVALEHLGSRGYVIYGARDSDEAGTAVTGIADENGEGHPGVLIGAPFAQNTFGSTPTVGGAVYAVWGFGSRRR